jgi:nucleoside-diphosphate-sugar epimerase
MSKPTALVTGGCGFVGRRFVRWLLAHDYRVTVVDDLSTGLAPERWPAHLRLSPAQAADVTFHLSDFRDYAKEASADFDMVLHLAAVVGGRMTIEGDPLAVATDLAIDATFFNWIVKRRPMPRKVLYFSSSAAYPIDMQSPTNHHPLSEEMIFDSQLGLPDMTYGWSKLTGEFLARYAAKQYGLDVVVYRPFSGYGEDQDFTYPFPSVVRRVACGESPIVVWGSGRQLRDFIYIEDVVDAVFASESRLAPGEALNLGSGVGVSFRRLAEVACGVIGFQAEIVNDATKPEGVFARVANTDRMFKYYCPTTSLERGIEITVEYQRASGFAPPTPSANNAAVKEGDRAAA